MDIQVIVEGEGLADVEIIRIPEGAAGREIVIAVAMKSGFPAEDGILFVEDQDTPVDLEAVIVGARVNGNVHHVHRARHVGVTVFYKESQKEKRFSPSARIQRVLDWAVSPEGFNIDPTIAPELELALHGEKTALPKNAHLGRYVHHPHHCLGLDVIRGVVPNGERAVTPANPSESAADADLASARFRAGVKRGQWRKVSYVFPILIVGMAAIEPDGSSSEYSFRFELGGFPGTAPAVVTWDCDANALLPANRRPQGSARVNEAFKSWGPSDTIYRPWERTSGAHNNWATTHPELAWHPKRDLIFILEDLHGLLTSNATALGNRPAA